MVTSSAGLDSLGAVAGSGDGEAAFFALMASCSFSKSALAINYVHVSNT